MLYLRYNFASIILEIIEIFETYFVGLYQLLDSWKLFLHRLNELLNGVTHLVVSFISPPLGNVGIKTSSATDTKDRALFAGFFVNKKLL